MKNLKLSLAALSLAATLLCATSAVAYTPDTTVYGAGSSAQFNTFALAAGLDNAWPGNAALCGEHHFSIKNGAALNDPRPGTGAAQTGNIWVVWNDAAATLSPGGRVCYYVTLDSVVGNREFFANATVTMSVPAGTADANIVPLLGAGEAINANIWGIVNNSKINTAFTDINAEDAKFATLRALTGPAGTQIIGKSDNGLGYGGFPTGTAIKSSFSSATALPVTYAITGTDPITGNPAREYIEIQVGASPILVIANTTNSTAGHTGYSKYSSITRQNLADLLEGNTCHIRAAFATGLPTDADVPTNVILREPLSGTYNTMEYDIPHNREIYVFTPGVVSGQETGVNPATMNPLNWTCAPVNGATRKRAVGTGEMVTQVNANADSIGYAFWGFSTFQGKANLKYLLVEGVDPLYSASSPNPLGVGVIPQCTTSGGVVTSCPILPFTDVTLGNYPIWSQYRAIYDPLDSTAITPTLVNYAQHAAVNLLEDFVPAYGTGLTPSMLTFRSHYDQVVQGTGETHPGGDEQPNNGFISGIRPTGGDMGGAMLSVQSELDDLNDAAARGFTTQQPAQQVNEFE